MTKFRNPWAKGGKYFENLDWRKENVLLGAETASSEEYLNRYQNSFSRLANEFLEEISREDLSSDDATVIVDLIREKIIEFDFDGRLQEDIPEGESPLGPVDLSYIHILPATREGQGTGEGIDEQVVHPLVDPQFVFDLNPAVEKLIHFGSEGKTIFIQLQFQPLITE